VTADDARQLGEVYDAVMVALRNVGTIAGALDDVAAGPLAEAVTALDVARTSTTTAWDALTWVRERIEGNG
jgi:hypothetical protein